MGIVGVNLTKVFVEKKSVQGANVNVSNNVSLKDVVSKDFVFGSSTQQGLEFKFSFISTYTPDLGTIDIEGSVLYLEKDKVVNDLKQGWEKDKKVPVELMQQILNTALHKCNVQALKLSEDVNLPTPVPLPKISRSEPKKPKK